MSKRNLSHWVQVAPERWRRRDGALVRYDENFTFANPMNPRSRMYTVWEPDPGEGYLKMKSKRGLTWPRRYKTPLAGMLAADREWPLGVAGPDETHPSSLRSGDE